MLTAAEKTIVKKEAGDVFRIVKDRFPKPFVVECELQIDHPTGKYLPVRQAKIIAADDDPVFFDYTKLTTADGELVRMAVEEFARR